jgi:hypothetical protein
LGAGKGKEDEGVEIEGGEDEGGEAEGGEDEGGEDEEGEAEGGEDEGGEATTTLLTCPVQPAAGTAAATRALCSSWEPTTSITSWKCRIKSIPRMGNFTSA